MREPSAIMRIFCGCVVFAALSLLVAKATPVDGADKKEAVKEYTYKQIKQDSSTTDLKILVYFPPNWSPSDKRPAIVFFHGGAWRVGSPKQFAEAAKYFAERGMVAASADYRLKWRHDSDAAKSAEDAKSAIRWIRENAAKLGVDPNRIVSAGGSAGGHLAACTALCGGLEPRGENSSVSSKPNALVLFNPVMDITEIVKRVPRAKPEREKWARTISPTLSMPKQVPPTIVFYGTQDRLLEQGRQFVDKAKSSGNRVELYTFEGQDHGFFNDSPWREQTFLLADKFLASLGYLQGEPTVKVPAR